MTDTLLYGVSQLNRAVADVLVHGLGRQGRIYVKGEIGQVSVRRSPTYTAVYFILRENDEVLSCVSWGRELMNLLCQDTCTGEIFLRPRNPADVFVEGRQVICAGTIATYAKGGGSRYQLRVSNVTDTGAGLLDQQFRILKERLGRMGYFAQERKRPLPNNPVRVALVTSPTGAVIHDFLRNAIVRGIGARLRLYPVRVQGENAGPEIAAAVRRADADNWGQVIVLIRGGGSAQDLACFNDVQLAQAIFTARHPVLAGIGHEVDFTIADLTADVRASTPTKAAELLWTPRKDIFAFITQCWDKAHAAFAAGVTTYRQQLSGTAALLRALSPAVRFAAFEKEVGFLFTRAQQSLRSYSATGRKELDAISSRPKAIVAQRIAALDETIANLLQRATVAVRAQVGTQAENFSSLENRYRPLLKKNVDMTAQELASLVQQVQVAGALRLRETASAVTLAGDKLHEAFRNVVTEQGHALDKLELALEAVSPLKPLERGWGLVRTGDGHILRDTEGVKAGMSLSVVLRDGSLEVQVVAVHRDKKTLPATPVAEA